VRRNVLYAIQLTKANFKCSFLAHATLISGACMCWLLLSTPFFRQNLNYSNTIFRILQELSSGDSSLIACILWSIWKQHNNKVWEVVSDVQCFVVERAKSLLFDWESS